MSNIRVKTIWFKKEEGGRDSDQTASVIAAVIWKIADRTVINLSKADYDIITPQRGFTLLAEMIAFMVHLSDRLLYGRVEDERRNSLMQAMGNRLAGIMEKNIHDVVGDDGFDYQTNFLDMLNRRSENYADFDFPADQPNFAVRRYLAGLIRDVMEERDQSWVMDQIMEIEVPLALETLKKTIDGLFKQP